MNNQQRAEDVMAEWLEVKRFAPDVAQQLADANPPILMPDLPEPRRTDRLEMSWIPFEEDQDEYFDIWVSGPGFLKVDGSRKWRKQLTPENARSIAFALLAAADYAEKSEGHNNG